MRWATVAARSKSALKVNFDWCELLCLLNPLVFAADAVNSTDVKIVVTLFYLWHFFYVFNFFYFTIFFIFKKRCKYHEKNQLTLTWPFSSGAVYSLHNTSCNLVITVSTVVLNCWTVVRVTSQVNGRPRFSDPCSSKTPWQILMKFVTSDYVVDPTTHAKLGFQGLNGSVPS